MPELKPIPDIKVDVAQLRSLRIQHGYTQAQVARALGYDSDVGYVYVEKGRIRLTAERAAKLAYLYGIPMERLFVSP